MSQYIYVCTRKISHREFIVFVAIVNLIKYIWYDCDTYIYEVIRRFLNKCTNYATILYIFVLLVTSELKQCSNRTRKVERLEPHYLAIIY